MEIEDHKRNIPFIKLNIKAIQKIDGVAQYIDSSYPVAGFPAIKKREYDSSTKDIDVDNN
ncbi:hypothetical protein [Methanosarcina vacuolata]|uniref:hypothetical protein n=1 Tax=Methanosarcina vacuolata TaxID=2215 RepID=UPI0018DD2D1F|nr:hypothetical protein [Methanosarcina vacuolata]